MFSSRVATTAAISSTLCNPPLNPSPFLCLFSKNNKSGKNKSFISSPLYGSVIQRGYRKMEASSSFVTRASAQPLTNADSLIDSVETFIFDCDGNSTICCLKTYVYYYLSTYETDFGFNLGFDYGHVMVWYGIVILFR